MMDELAGNKFQVELEAKDGEVTTVMVEFDIKGGRATGLKGTGPSGEKYNVHLVFKKAQGGECWVCVETPCPPNRYKEVDPCPIDPPPKKKHLEE